MANNWRYYQQTGQAGGTTTLQYVDSFNGDDANSGAYNAPKQTIQGALDVASGTLPRIVCAGYFNEGDFLNRRSNPSFIMEGVVNIDGVGKTSFNPNIRMIGVNSLASESTIFFNFGVAIFKNYVNNIVVEFSTGNNYGNLNLCIFLGGKTNTASVSSGGWINRFDNISNCLFINSELNHNHSFTYLINFNNLTFINSHFKFITGTGTGLKTIQSCVFDSLSTLDCASLTGFSIDYNAIIGTLTQKIRLDGVWYNNTEAVQSATSFLANDLPSTTDPLFNLLNDKDYTLQVGSLLRTASSSGSHIGFADYAGVLGASSVEWTVTDIDNTTTAGEAYLTGDEPVGTMESNAVQLFDKKRVIKRIMMPDFIINPSIGETIGRLASFNTPYLISLEIQYGDNALTMNGTWLRVPIGTQPLYDSVNLVGNDDPLFDIDNSVAIACKFIKYKITLRSNETPI
jgi:hypothetical protein